MHLEQENGATKSVDGRGRCNNLQMNFSNKECCLLISLNQLKLKVAEMTQTKVTPF
jgi:hypothetical protein